MLMEMTAPPKSEDARYWPPLQGDWTYEDYARLPHNGFRYEVIKGELFMSPAPSTRHQLIVTYLLFALFDFVKKHKLGELFSSPIDVKLDQLASPVQPDILFVSQKRLSIVTEQTIEGAPDLIVEILSPGTAQYDRQTKFQLYAAAGVREYWLVDPDVCAIDIYALRGHAYALLSHFNQTDQTRSEVLPDFTLLVSSICQPVHTS